MNQFVHGVVRAVAETFTLPGPILEIGSYQVSGQNEMANFRNLFPGMNYRGVDIRPGPGVDEVADVEALPYPDESFGTILALNTFEHVRRFWRGFEEAQRVLRPDGVLLVTLPFYFHIHDYPSDYWRFTLEALNVLLEGYPYQILGQQGPRRRPASVWAVAFREEHLPPSLDQFAHYRSLLGRYARQPLPWARRLRYQVGRWLCGRAPFAPYLDLEDCETELRIVPRLPGRGCGDATRANRCRGHAGCAAESAAGYAAEDPWPPTWTENTGSPNGEPYRACRSAEAVR